MFQVLFNLATCSNYSITTYFKISKFHFFEKGNKGHLKISTIYNGQIFLYCRFNKIIKGPGTTLQSAALRQYHIVNVCYATV